MSSKMERNMRMPGGWLRRTGFLLSLLLGLAAAMPAHAAGPGPEFKLRTNAEATFVSPDRQIRLEQYFADKGDDYLYQFWTFDDQRQHPSLLNPGESIDLARYPA